MWEGRRVLPLLPIADLFAQLSVSILWTCSQYALLDPTLSSVHICALRAPPAPSTLSLANLRAAAAAPARLPTFPVSRSASRALTPAPASSPAPSSPTATASTPQSATRTTALSAATLPTAALCARERLWALTLRAAAPTAALQPTFSTSALEAHPHPPSAPTATAHASRVLPAASAPM